MPLAKQANKHNNHLSITEELEAPWNHHPAAFSPEVASDISLVCCHATFLSIYIHKL